MEFRDKLLSSEIRHVTELVNMLSYELVILQDFLKDEFGIRYTKFRNRHALAFEGANLNRSLAEVGGEGLGLSSRSRRQNEEHAQQRAQSHQSTAASSVSGDPLATQCNTTDSVPVPVEPNFSVDDSVGSKNEEYEDSDLDSNESGNDKSWHLNDSQSDHSERGRSRLGIWKQFDWRKLPNGRTLVKCRTCFATVSAVPKRMEKHYLKCTLNKPEGEVKTALRSSSLRISTSSSTTTSSSRKGSVWSHFDTQTGPGGKTLVICKYCHHKVSNHSTRMSRHLQACDKSPVYLESRSQTQADIPSNDEESSTPEPNVSSAAAAVSNRRMSETHIGTLGMGTFGNDQFSGFGA